MARTQARVVATVNTIHMPNRTISMTHQVPIGSRQAMVDNNRVDIARSRLELLRLLDHRPTQAVITPRSRAIKHMVSTNGKASTNVPLMIDTEMGPMTGRAVSQQEPTTILDACREMHRGIDSLEEHLKQLDILYTQRASETRDVSRIRKEIENISNRFIDASSGLKDRIEKLAKDPQSKIPRNAPQVGRVYRRLQDANNQFQQLGLKHRNELRAQKARDMRTVNPEATEEQIQKAVDNEEGAQIFRIAVCTLCQRYFSV